MSSPDPIRIVLIGTQHPGNIGSAARAMKTMGLSNLVLVSPRRFPDAEASALAAGAEDILLKARVVQNLDEALEGCIYALGTTARDRAVSLPEFSPRQAANTLLAQSHSGSEVALLFGRERTGLENEELMRCHGRVFIPCNPDYASLNLASAVQVLSYEIRLRRLELEVRPAKPQEMTEAMPASLDQLERLFSHLNQFMDDIDFHKGRSPDMINQRLRRLFLRAQLDEREIKIIRGLLSDAQYLINQSK